MSSGISTALSLQVVQFELVLCVLPLNLSTLALKTSIEGKPVQIHSAESNTVCNIPLSMENKTVRHTADTYTVF